METPEINKPLIARSSDRGNPGELPAHLSCSQISTFIRCGLQYKFSYVDKIKSKPSFALDLGKSVHSAIETNYIQKITSDTDLPLDDVIIAYKDSVKNLEIETKDQVTREDFNEYKEKKKKEEDIGENAVKMYHKTIAPRVYPLMVEKSFELDLDIGKPLVGYIDLVEKGGEVFADTKTSGKRYDQFRADVDIQLSTYFLALQSMGLNPKIARFDVLIKKKETEIQQLTTRRTKNDLEATVKFIQSVAADIQRSYDSGYFRPNPSDQTCSFCGYKALCPLGKKYVKKY